MKLLFVVNPISGGIDKEPFLKKAVNMDGEVIGKFETLKIKLIPGAIRLLTHLGNKYMKNASSKVPDGLSG